MRARAIMSSSSMSVRYTRPCQNSPAGTSAIPEGGSWAASQPPRTEAAMRLTKMERFMTWRRLPSTDHSHEQFGDFVVAEELVAGQRRRLRVLVRTARRRVLHFLPPIDPER